MIFDPTINFGHLLTGFSLIVAGAAAYYGMKAELKTVDQRILEIEKTLEELAKVIVQTARQDERIAALERRIDGLEAVPHAGRGRRSSRS
jgi:fructoselysine-6-P-deglycase FrlB-like protein